MGELAKPEFATSEKVRSLPDIDALEIVADWREDLTMRIRRARLRQEFDGVSPEEIMALSAETEDSSSVCVGPSRGLSSDEHVWQRS
jgi:hypothetical protein